MKHERLLVRVEGSNEAADRLRAALTMNPRYVLVDRAPQFVVRITVADVDEVTFDGVHGELESWIATEIQALASGHYRVAQNGGTNFDDRVVSILCNEEHFEAIQEGVVKGLDRFVQQQWARKHRIRRWFMYPLVLFLAGFVLIDKPETQDVTRRGSGGGAPTTAEYVVSEASASLSAEVAPSAANQVPVSSSSTAAAWGTVPEAAGGTNQTTYTQGDLLYASAANTLSKLAKGTAGQFLKMNSSATAPEWSTQYILIYAGAGDTGGYNPAAGVNFYFSIQTGLDPNTIDGGPRIPIPISGTINYAEVAQSTLGTNGVNGENIVYKIRKNATTDSSTVATLDTDVDNVSGSNSSLGFAVTAGDFIAIKGTTPGAWTTPPTIMFWSVVMRLDVP